MTDARKDRGFKTMDKAQQRAIASKGGLAARAKGTAHTWTSEEAREAGRKGGTVSARRHRRLAGIYTAPPANVSHTGIGEIGQWRVNWRP